MSETSYGIKRFREVYYCLDEVAELAQHYPLWGYRRQPYSRQKYGVCRRKLLAKVYKKKFSDFLFRKLIRPSLEFVSVIWDHQNAVHSDKVESIQKHFLIFCVRRLGNGWDSNIRL